MGKDKEGADFKPCPAPSDADPHQPLLKYMLSDAAILFDLDDTLLASRPLWEVAGPIAHTADRLISSLTDLEKSIWELSSSKAWPIPAGAEKFEAVPLSKPFAP